MEGLPSDFLYSSLSYDITKPLVPKGSADLLQEGGIEAADIETVIFVRSALRALCEGAA
jgi:hypothetical protein